jgi:hypothetical protein
MDRPAPYFLRAVPFFLSALLFVSALFTLFSPLPLLVFSFHASLWLVVLAFVVNLGLVTALAGWVSTFVYIVMVGPIVFLVPYLLVRKQASAQRTVSLVLLAMALLTASGIGLYSGIKKTNPLIEFKKEISLSVQQLKTMSGNDGADWEVSPEELEQNIVREFPSAAGIFAFIMAVSNLLLLLRLNPRRMRESLSFQLVELKSWKSPSHLVWPTILAGASIVFDWGVGSQIGLNVFKFLMAVYGLQGLAILASIFDAWKIQGLARTLIFTVLVVMLTPLVLALGFFDLWFDFRVKIRQI